MADRGSSSSAARPPSASSPQERQASSATTASTAAISAAATTPGLVVKAPSPTTMPSPANSAKGSGRKSPSIAARAAMFEAGGKKRPTSPPIDEEAVMASREGAASDGARDVSQPAKAKLQEASAATVTKPTPLRRTTSPPFFPSTRPTPPSSAPSNSDRPGAASPQDTAVTNPEAEASSSPSPTKMPIVQILEVENELRKREESITGGELERLSENDVESDSDVGSSAIGDGAERSGRNTPLEEGSLGTNAMEISDSEPESHVGPGDEDDEEGEEEWEDFMAQYWLSSGNAVAPEAAAAIIAEEDTDLRPCAMEPELDEEPNALSPIRTGCIDIDMDFSLSNDGEKSDGNGGGNHLSELGQECSLAVARALQEGGGMEALRIDVGRMVEAEGSRPTKKGQVLNEEELGPADEHDAPRDVPILREWASPAVEAPSTAGGSEAGASAVSSKTAPLPDPDLVHMTGPILTRTSLRSLVMKKWHPSHWMHYGPHALLIFRNAEHMDDWLHNPYHGKKQRDFLVKLQVDFCADMQHDDGGGKEGVLGHRILPIKKKSYGKNEPEMYQFKLERWTNLGCSVLAAFASPEEGEVQILHDTINRILKTCPHNGLRNIDHMLK